MNAEEIILQGQDFLAKKLAELEARIDRISFVPTATAEMPQEEPKRSEDRPVKVLQRSPEVHTIQSGGGGRYTGPFAVSVEAGPGGLWVYTVKSGIISAHILLESGGFYSNRYTMPEVTAFAEDLSSGMYLHVSMDITGLASGNTVGISCAVAGSNGTVKLADVSGTSVTQRHYGDIDIFFPNAMGMEICEDGVETCILNFGQDVSCSAIGRTVM